MTAVLVAGCAGFIGGGDSRTFNVGTGEGVTVLEVLRAAERVAGRPISHSFGPRRQGDPDTLVADVSRIESELGWRARHSDIDTVIRTAMAWQANRLY